MKKKTSDKIQIEFEKEHLYVLISALETYSRLQSGQISYAMDNVYADRDLSADERKYLENVIRYIAFPSNPKRQYDGHGGFYDQYNNEYDESGNIINEAEDWKNFKNRPHLDYPNSSFGVGCKEMKEGTIAFEIRKVIDQYFHYERNEGYRRVCDVSGDGMKSSYSGVPVPKIVGFEPSLKFKIPKRYQKTVNEFFLKEDWKNLWGFIENRVYKNNPLPKGAQTQVRKDSENNWSIIIEEPYIA